MVVYGKRIPGVDIEITVMISEVCPCWYGQGCGK